MNTSDLAALFQRDLAKLIQEVNAYEPEETLWLKASGINNSAGNLALHLIGNLNHFIGHVLGHTGYQRDRNAEFNNTSMDRAKIVRDIQDTSDMISKVTLSLDKSTLESTFPLEVFGYPMPTEYFLIHLYGHLNYHLGQINYHRRLLAVRAES